MAMEKQVMRLDEMDSHQVCVVHDIEAPDDDLERLMSMGVCRGRVVTLIQRGDPLILKVFGSRLGVSARLARRVLVSCCSTEECAVLASARGGSASA
jgi:Fe2+ transport system protein FeoA